MNLRQLKQFRLFFIALLLICTPTKKASAVSWPTVQASVSLSVLAGSILTNIVANKVEKACQELSLVIYFLRNAKSEEELLTHLNMLPKNLLQRIKDSFCIDDGSGEREMTNKEIANILYNLSEHPNFQLEKWLARDEYGSKIAANISLATAIIAAIATGFAIKSIKELR